MDIFSPPHVLAGRRSSRLYVARTQGSDDGGILTLPRCMMIKYASTSAPQEGASFPYNYLFFKLFFFFFGNGQIIRPTITECRCKIGDNEDSLGPFFSRLQTMACIGSFFKCMPTSGLSILGYCIQRIVSPLFKQIMTICVAAGAVIIPTFSRRVTRKHRARLNVVLYRLVSVPESTSKCNDPAIILSMTIVYQISNMIGSWGPLLCICP